ncbi:UPF0481 protein At3g47200-like [Cryptomeria japonica]|uniref:UPF0481 protein At3g47200-like n=1 Tax=Cryptomeria japonica TaxID=3369 RepID=UPI0027D9F4E9|nr:UPF0481 protein At3g47200-like [Cryptomeria japonica]
MAENKLISEEWKEEVKIFLEATPQAVPADRGSVRLSKALMNAKTEAYAPRMVSLGPYHHFSVKDEPVGPFHQRLTHLSQMEVYKLRSTRKAARNDPELIKKLFARVSQSDMIAEFRQFYDWKIEEDDVQNFAWMMMIDALFLSYFLKSGFEINRQESTVTVHSGASSDVILPAKASLRCDIVKLENQIPLSLLKKLDEIVHETSTLDSIFHSQMRHLSSFQISDIEKLHFNEKHLLGCIHKYVSSFLQVSGGEQESPPTWFQRVSNVMGNLIALVFSCCYRHPAKCGQRDFLDKYSAKELRKAGIKFKSFKEKGKIRFCKNSDTLYLPQITISDTYTEVLLRNLLALEFNEGAQEKLVTNYVELMDCLIDTPEDVDLLRENHVIDRQSMMITDEYVAKMWDGMSKPFFLAGFLELPGGLKAQIREVLIKNYYKSKIKTQLSELYSEYLSSPWKVMALLVGIIVLVLTVLQTFCSVHSCQAEQSTTSNARKRFRPFG